MKRRPRGFLVLSVFVGTLVFCLFADVSPCWAQRPCASNDSEPSKTAGKTGPFEPTWESLIANETPDWLLDAKFGIYAHWGVYSVPAFETEWYAKRMYDRKSSVYRHHVKTYGDPAEFGYKDLVPLFKAQKFNPDKWAELIERSGAKYAGIAVVHHDGFLLWDSKVNRWNAGKMGPKRDLYGELAAALRRRGLRTIATFHHIRTFNWYLPGTGGFGEIKDQTLIDEIKRLGWDLVDPKYADLYWNSVTGKYEDFIAQWQAKGFDRHSRFCDDRL